VLQEELSIEGDARAEAAHCTQPLARLVGTAGEVEDGECGEAAHCAQPLVHDVPTVVNEGAEGTARIAEEDGGRAASAADVAIAAAPCSA
jgi:hypothetical protein